MSTKGGVKLTRALSLVPYNTELHLKMAMIINEVNGLDAAMEYVAGLNELMPCGHPRAAVRSSNPGAALTTCWCAGCQADAEARNIKMESEESEQ